MHTTVSSSWRGRCFHSCSSTPAMKLTQRGLKTRSSLLSRATHFRPPHWMKSWRREGILGKPQPPAPETWETPKKWEWEGGCKYVHLRTGEWVNEWKNKFVESIRFDSIRFDSIWFVKVERLV
jgi:hypothetical protein